MLVSSWKKRKKKLPKQRTSDVFFNAKKKVLHLRDRVFVIEINIDKLNEFLYKKRKLLKYSALVLFLVVVLISSISSNADTANFYSTNCLGNWENPKNVEGVPEIKNNKNEKDFSRNNSAVLNNTNGELYCGDFSGEIPKDIAAKKFVLKFSIFAADKLLEKIEPTTITDETPATFDTINPSTDDSSLLEIKKEDILDAEIPILPKENESTLPTSDNQTSTTPETITEPVSLVGGDSASPSGPVSYFRKEFFAVARAQEVLPKENIDQNIEPTLSNSEEIQNVGNSQITNTEVLPATEKVVPDVKVIKDYLKVSYTVDGKDWKFLGMINEENIYDPSFEIPLENLKLEDISKIQISVSPVVSIDQAKVFYLDSMWILSEYEKIENKEALPKIKIKDLSLGIISGNTDFSNNEEIKFDVKDPEFSRYKIAELVNQDKADLIEDKDKVLESFLQDKRELPPVELPPIPINESLLQETKDVVNNFIFPKLVISGISNKKTRVSTYFLSIPKAKAQATAEITEAKVLDSLGQDTEIKTIIENIIVDEKDIQQVKIIKPNREFKPGKYSLKITLLTETAIIETEQDFTWGVLVVNTDKSVYNSGDDAYLQMGVLSDEGHTICNADLEMEITSPSGTLTHFSTSDESIIRDKQCGLDNVINTPDYFAHFLDTNETGEYKIKLTATTLKGAKTINDSFQVDPNAMFDVKRVTVSRIQPAEKYSVTIYLTAREDFYGTIIEHVPGSFEISKPKKSTAYDLIDIVNNPLNQNEEKILSWILNIKKGETKILGYYYDAPNISPEIFLLGPLEFFGGEKVDDPMGKLPAFKEVRLWQIASDAPPTNWGYERTLTIDHTKVPNTDQTNFPVLVSLTDNTLRTVANGGRVTSSSGYDIEFFPTSDLTGTKLSHEIESYSPTTGQIEMWVKLPTVATASDTVFYIAYGNSAITTSQENIADVWSNSYVGVWHFRDGSTLSVTDSTGANSATNNSMTAGTGQIDGAAVRSGSTAYIDLGSETASGTRDISYWIKQTGLGAQLHTYIVSTANSDYVVTGTVGASGALPNGGILVSAVANQSASKGTSVAVANGGWSYITAQKTTSQMNKIFIDGNDVTIASPASNYYWGGATVKRIVGGSWTGGSLGSPFTGTIDEVHISSSTRSADWVKTEYNNQYSPSTFITLGSEVTAYCTAITTGNWSDGTKWSGCSGSGGKPGTGDHVIINSGVTMTMNENSAALATITINSTGVLDTSSSNYSLTGTNVDVQGTLTVNASTITLTGTSGTLFTKGGGGTFTSGTSTVVMSGNGSATIALGTPSFYNLTSSGTGTKSLGEVLTATGTVTISAGTLDTVSGSNYTVNAGKIIINGGTFTPQASTINITGTSGTLFTLTSGTFTAGTSTVNLTGNGTATVASGAPSFYNLTLNSTGTKSLGVALTVTNTLTMTSGTLDTVSGSNYAISAGWIVINGGTLIANASTITLTGTSGTLFTKSSGTFTAGTSTVVLNGNSGTGTWVQQIASGSRNWTSIASSSDGTKLAAGTFSGDIYTSTNSGVDWTDQTNSGAHVWQSIASSSDGVKLAAVDSIAGYIYTSTDSGVSWSTQSNSSGAHNWQSIASSSDGVKLAAVDTTPGYIYTSTNSGASWTQQTLSGSRYWQTIASSSDGTKLAAGVGGGSNYIYTSTDSGVNWTQQSASGTRNWQTIASSSNGTKLTATVNSDYIYTSTDSGVSWSTQSNSSGSRAWTSVTSSSDGTKLAAVVSTGYIYTSNNSGASWTQQTSPGSRAWVGIASSSDGTKLAAVVGGGSNYIYTYVEPTTIASGTPSFYNLTSSGTGTKVLGETLTVTNSLTISAGTLDTVSGSNYTVNAGKIIINGGTFTPQASTINITGTSGTLFTYSSGTFTAGTSTVNLTGNGTATVNSGNPILYKLISSGTGTKTLGGTLTITNTFNITNGTFALGSSSLVLNGTSSGSPFAPPSGGGVFSAGTGIVSYTGGVSPTTIESSVTYYSLTINGSGKTFNPNGAINGNVAGTLTLSNGTLNTTGSNYAINFGKMNIASATTAIFTANASVITLNAVSGTLFTRGANGVFNANTSEVKITSAGTGALTLMSSANTFHKLTINTTGTYPVNAGGVITMSNANAANKLYVQTGVLNDGGNTIVGTANGTLQVDSGAGLCISGTSAGTNLTCDSGAVPTTASTFPINYTNGNITLAVTSTIYYNANSAATVSAVPTYGNLYFKPLLASSGKTYTLGGALTINGDFTINPKGTGPYILTTNMGGDIVVASGKTTTITGNTGASSSFDTRPASTNYNISTGLLNVAAGGTLDCTSAASNITLTGTSGTLFTLGGTFTVGSSTVNLSGNGDATLNSGSIGFYDLVSSGSGVKSISSNNIAVTHNLTISAGTFDPTASNQVAGNGTNSLIVNNGGTIRVSHSTFVSEYASFETVTLNSGSTVDYFLNGTQTVDNTISPYSNLKVTTGGIKTLGGDIIVGNVMTINTGATFALSSFNMTLSGTTGTPFVITGTFTPSTGTVSYTGNYASGNTNVVPTTYNNLVLNNGSETYTLAGDITVGNVLTITAGTLDGSSRTITLSGTTGTPFISSGGSFYPNTGTVSYTGNYTIGDTVISTDLYYYNLILNNSSETYVFPVGDLFVENVLTVTAGTLSPGSRNITLAGASGIPFTNEGTFIPGTSTVFYVGDNSGGNTIITNVVYNNLTINNSSETYVLNGNYIVNGNLTITAGTLDTLNIGGSFNTSATSPGTVVDDATVGTLSWVNPNNAKVSDDTYTTVTGTSGTQYSHYLKATNFSFSIPSGATIDGIKIDIQKKGTGGMDLARDSEIKIVKSNGTIGTTNYAVIGSGWPTSEAYSTYGSSSDLWGETWAYSDINSSNFGVVVSAKTTKVDTTPVGSVDHIRATIYYTTAGGTDYAISAGNVSIAGSGALKANDSEIIVAGNWYNGGTFTKDTSNVTLNSATTSAVSGITDFYDLTITHSSAKEVDFSNNSGDIIDVSNLFTVTGHTGALIKLYSDSAGNKWHFHPTGTAVVDYVDVKDGGGETGSINIYPTNSVNSGNNDPLWIFPVCESNGTGGGDWNNGASWNGGCSGVGGIPDTDEDVTILVDDMITLDINTPVVDLLTINGALDTKDFVVNAKNLFIGDKGTLEANASTINLSGTTGTIFTIDGGGMFNGGSSNVIMNGDADITLTSGAITFYNLELLPTTTASRIYTFGAEALLIGNNFTINPTSSGDCPLFVNMGANITVMNITTITKTDIASSTLDLRPASTDYDLDTRWLEVASGCTLDASGSASSVNLSGTSGTLFTLGGTFAITGGTPTVSVSGNGDAVINSDPITFYDYYQVGGGVKSAGAAITINHELRIAGGAFNPTSSFVVTGSGTNTLTVTNGGTIRSMHLTFAGDYASFETISLEAGSTVDYFLNGTQTVSSTISPYSNLTVSTGGTKTLGGDITVGNVMTIGAGATLGGSSYNMTLSGTTGTPFVKTGTFTSSTGTVTYTGNYASGNTNVVSTTYNNLILNNGSETYVLVGATTANGNLTITSGTLDITTSNYAFFAGNVSIGGSGIFRARDSEITVAGSWSNAGTFTKDTSNVTFNTSNLSTFDGATNFYDLTITHSAAKLVRFPTSGPYIIDVSHIFNVAGHSGEPITLNSIEDGTKWHFHPTGTAVVDYADVKDGGCEAGAITINTTNSTDSGNNDACWNFYIPTITFDMSDNAVDFGALSAAQSKYATAGAGSGGSTTPVDEAHNFSVTDNSPSGYSVNVIGASLTNANGGHVITPIGGTNSAPNPSHEQFGLRIDALGGSGTVSAPYAASGFAYAADGSTASQVCSASTGDGVTTTYSVQYLSNIAPTTSAGTYHATLKYLVTGNF